MGDTQPVILETVSRRRRRGADRHSRVLTAPSVGCRWYR